MYLKKKCKLNIIELDIIFINFSSLFSGSVHSGMGFGALQKLFACMNLPGLSSETYKRYENVVGLTVEEVAKNSCKQAAAEEKILMIENIEKICQEL